MPSPGPSNVSIKKVYKGCIVKFEKHCYGIREQVRRLCHLQIDIWHLHLQGLNHELLQMLTFNTTERIQGGEQKWGPLCSWKNWQNKSLDRYFQEVILWAQLLHFLISRKAVKSFMVDVYCSWPAVTFMRLAATFCKKSVFDCMYTLHQNHTYPFSLEQFLRAIWNAISWAPSVQFSSVQLLSCVWLFATLWISACQASLSITNSQRLHKLMSIDLVMPSSHLIFCRPLLLLPPIPPSIRVFSNKSTLRMRWPKYWSFSFSISPSNEHPGLMFFRMDWLDLLAV